MWFSSKTVAVNGRITTPHSMVSIKEGRVAEVRPQGILVLYNEGTSNELQQAYYSYDWLNQYYGDERHQLDDDIPF